VGGILLRGEQAPRQITSSPQASRIPPAGFTPFTAPRGIVKVHEERLLDAQQAPTEGRHPKLMPRARHDRADGQADLVSASGCSCTGRQSLRQGQRIASKTNEKTGPGTKKELVLPFIDAMIQGGVKPENITILEVVG